MPPYSPLRQGERPPTCAHALQARNAMVAKAAVEQAAETSTPGAKEGAWKWALRKQIWDYMEENNIAK